MCADNTFASWCHRVGSGTWRIGVNADSLSTALPGVIKPFVSVTGILWLLPAFMKLSVQFSSVQSLSRVRLFVTSWIAARQASLSITNSRSSLRLTSIESVIYFCFIDYAKASDCVDHNKLWKILQEMGIPDHLTCLLRNLYTGQEATVRTGHGTTDWFQIRKGVR